MRAGQDRYKSKCFKLILIGLIFSNLIFTSCLSIKPGSVKSGKNLYETFFVGEQGTQYFIKPLLFSNQLNGELTLDITFRYKNEVKDSANVNISIFSKEIYKVADSLRISNAGNTVILKKMNYLFSERNKDNLSFRFSSRANLIDVKNLFAGNNWDILLYKNGISTNFKTPKATQKKIEKLNFEIFTLF